METTIHYDASCIGFQGFWNIVQGIDVCSGSVDFGTIENVASTSTSNFATALSTFEHVHWDGKDAQAHALLALSVKCVIIPHIHSCKTLKEAWDTLATLYQARNEVLVAYLRKRLESEHMNEGDSMDGFLTWIKNLKK